MAMGTQLDGVDEPALWKEAVAGTRTQYRKDQHKIDGPSTTQHVVACESLEGSTQCHGVRGYDFKREGEGITELGRLIA